MGLIEGFILNNIVVILVGLPLFTAISFYFGSNTQKKIKNFSFLAAILLIFFNIYIMIYGGAVSQIVGNFLNEVKIAGFSLSIASGQNSNIFSLFFLIIFLFFIMGLKGRSMMNVKIFYSLSFISCFFFLLFIFSSNVFWKHGALIMGMVVSLVLYHSMEKGPADKEGLGITLFSLIFIVTSTLGLYLFKNEFDSTGSDGIIDLNLVLHIFDHPTFPKAVLFYCVLIPTMICFLPFPFNLIVGIDSNRWQNQVRVYFFATMALIGLGLLGHFIPLYFNEELSKFSPYLKCWAYFSFFSSMVLAARKSNQNNFFFFSGILNCGLLGLVHRTAEIYSGSHILILLGIVLFCCLENGFAKGPSDLEKRIELKDTTNLFYILLVSLMMIIPWIYVNLEIPFFQDMNENKFLNVLLTISIIIMVGLAMPKTLLRIKNDLDSHYYCLRDFGIFSLIICLFIIIGLTFFSQSIFNLFELPQRMAAL